MIFVFTVEKCVCACVRVCVCCSVCAHTRLRVSVREKVCGAYHICCNPNITHKGVLGARHASLGFSMLFV